VRGYTLRQCKAFTEAIARAEYRGKIEQLLIERIAQSDEDSFRKAMNRLENGDR